MLASRTLQQHLRGMVNNSRRALHISSKFQFRSTSTPLVRIRQPSAIRLTQITASLTAVRFNSSSTPSTDSTGPPTSPGFLESFIADPPVSIPPTAGNVSPDSMGYLHSLGIDFGFGTTTIIQTLLESMHVYSGLPWWGTIMASVVAVRIIQFPFYCKMSSNAARMKEVNPLLTPITKRMQAASKRRDHAEMMQHRAEMKRTLELAKVNRLWLAFPITQIPIFYGFYRCLRGMSDLPVPELRTEGLYWFTDLSQADPTLVLPVCASLMIALQIATGGEAGATTMARSVKTGLMIALPMMSFGVSYAWPAALAFYLLTNTSFGVLQSWLLRSETIREKLNLYPLSPEHFKNPLSVSGLSALNVVKPAVPGKIIDVPGKKKQIGGEGGLLDKLTGGKDEEGSGWSIKSWKEQAHERGKEGKHKAYEARRKRRLEQEKLDAKLEREKKQRMEQQNLG